MSAAEAEARHQSTLASLNNLGGLNDPLQPSGIIYTRVATNTQTGLPIDLKVTNTRRSQLAQTRGRKVSAALARGGRRSPGTAVPHTKRTGLVEKLWSTSPPPTQKTVSWGSWVLGVS